MTDSLNRDQQSIDVLTKRFLAAYKELRRAWLKTGGGMEMQVQFRDADAEKAFQRRSAAAKKGAAKRRKYD